MVDASPDFHCLISDDYYQPRLLAIYCVDCLPYQMNSQTCAYCQQDNECCQQVAGQSQQQKKKNRLNSRRRRNKASK